jgi:hypothetical protein
MAVSRGVAGPFTWHESAEKAKLMLVAAANQIDIATGRLLSGKSPTDVDTNDLEAPEILNLLRSMLITTRVIFIGLCSGVEPPTVKLQAIRTIFPELTEFHKWPAVQPWTTKLRPCN